MWKGVKNSVADRHKRWLGIILALFCISCLETPNFPLCDMGILASSTFVLQMTLAAIYMPDPWCISFNKI